MLKEIQPQDIYYCGAEGEPSGYAHPSYIQTLSDFGTPMRLSCSGSWLLSRTIPGTNETDGIGAYPFFVCDDFSALVADLNKLGEQLVSVAMVPDPMSSPPPKHLIKLFDVAAPFKTHFLADLSISFSQYLRRHHRRYAKRALGDVEVQLAQKPFDYAIEWADLYSILVARHGISGIRAFSPKVLAMQLAVPGCHYFRALCDGITVGAFVCYLDRGIAYAHLISTTHEGQKMMAQYALYWKAIEHFRGHARWLVLGSTPGTVDTIGSKGLSAFKAGWATATCTAYFLGRILNRSRYNEICALSGHDGVSTFPAYRGGEFG